jgi:integrase/recombinase XerD
MFAHPELVEDYKTWYLAQGHTYVSAQEYYNNVKRYVKDGVEINQKTVNKFRLTAMRTTTSGALKSFFKFLVTHKEFPEDILNIRFDRNKQTKKYPKSISATEVKTIINNMPSLKYKIFTIFIFELGLRISEAQKLKWEDFNWTEWLLNKNEFGKVAIKNTKRNKFRTLPVKPDLMNLLYNAAPNKSSTGIPLGTLTFDFGISKYINRKDKPNEVNLYDYLHTSGCYYRDLIYKISLAHLGKRISPHWLRHSKAQILLDNGMPLDSLKELLGHSEISSTEIYAQASPVKVQKDLEAYDTFKKTQNSP